MTLYLVKPCTVETKREGEENRKEEKIGHLLLVVAKRPPTQHSLLHSPAWDSEEEEIVAWVRNNWGRKPGDKAQGGGDGEVDIVKLL